MEQYLIICLIGYISPCRIYLTPCWLCDIILVVERGCAHVLCFGVGEPAASWSGRLDPTAAGLSYTQKVKAILFVRKNIIRNFRKKSEYILDIYSSKTMRHKSSGIMCLPSLNARMFPPEISSIKYTSSPILPNSNLMS